MSKKSKKGKTMKLAQHEVMLVQQARRILKELKYNVETDFSGFQLIGSVLYAGSVVEGSKSTGVYTSSKSTRMDETREGSLPEMAIAVLMHRAAQAEADAMKEIMEEKVKEMGMEDKFRTAEMPVMDRESPEAVAMLESAVAKADGDLQ